MPEPSASDRRKAAQLSHDAASTLLIDCVELGHDVQFMCQYCGMQRTWGRRDMLTTEPGPDIKPYHDRQIVLLSVGEGRDWLDLTRAQASILAPALAGTLQVVRDFPPPDLFG